MCNFIGIAAGVTNTPAEIDRALDCDNQQVPQYVDYGA
jgi:hypothetical protein